MKNQHTPGPWHLVSHRPNLVKVETARVVICDAFGGLSDETMANARLIACAPEMLQALESIVEAYQRYFDVMPVAWKSYDDHARGIIAKAKGNQ